MFSHQSTFDLFVGAWLLLNITRTQNGVIIPDETYGRKPGGVISYTNTGFMSAILIATEESLRPSGLTLPATPDESEASWAIVGKHTLGYAGPFHFNNTFPGRNATHGQILHGPLIIATLPNFVGSTQQRNFTFHDHWQTLNLRGDLGGGVVDDLWWTAVENPVFASRENSHSEL